MFSRYSFCTRHTKPHASITYMYQNFNEKTNNKMFDYDDLFFKILNEYLNFRRNNDD